LPREDTTPPVMKIYFVMSPFRIRCAGTLPRTGDKHTKAVLSSQSEHRVKVSGLQRKLVFCASPGLNRHHADEL
jgi:hypothetical protein